MTSTTATSPITNFKGWVGKFSPEEKSNEQAATEYAEELYDNGNRDAIVFFLSSYLLDVARATNRINTRREERKATHLVRPILDPYEKVFKKAGLDTSKLTAPDGGRTHAQKAEARKAKNLNMIVRAGLLVRDISEDCELDLTPSFLNSMLSISGQMVMWGDATKEQLNARFDKMFNQTTSDLDTLGTIRAAITLLESGKVKTLRELTKKS